MLPEILIDMGAAHGNTSSLGQYLAYCFHVGCAPSIDRNKADTCHFGNGSEKSHGTAPIHFPLGATTVTFQAHILQEVTVPLLIFIDEMKLWGIYFNNIENTLVHTPRDQCINIKREGAHPFILWSLVINCHYTTTELSRLHRRFGHPHAEKLLQLLRKASLDNVTKTTRPTLEHITSSCGSCQVFAARRRRFKLTLHDKAHFNSIVYVDLFWIDEKTALHVVVEATRYQEARWVRSLNAENIWQALRICWIDVYVGPPDNIDHDAGKNLLAESFQMNADLFPIRTKATPVESAHSMSIVERYHNPVRRTYQIIKKETPDTNDDLALQMPIKAVNDSISAEGISTTYAVYGCIPRLGLLRGRHPPSTYQRALVVKRLPVPSRSILLDVKFVMLSELEMYRTSQTFYLLPLGLTLLSTASKKSMGRSLYDFEY